ncbi:MAG: hypothetical protein AB7S78_05835 [Candidatus Omnitrophota bacterium]
MKRIGIAASRISKGSLRFYNLYVVLISFLFSLLLFVVAGLSVFLAIGIVSFFGHETMTEELRNNWATIMSLCAKALGLAVIIFNFIALAINLKWTRNKN